MWVILNNAFISCVIDKNDPNKICVRGRVKGDITKAFEGKVNEVKSHPGCDYAYRAWVTKDELSAAMVKAVQKIDYTNFKDSVKESDRHDYYMDIWSVMYKFQNSQLSVAERFGL